MAPRVPEGRCHACVCYGESRPHGGGDALVLAFASSSNCGQVFVAFGGDVADNLRVGINDYRA